MPKTEQPNVDTLDYITSMLNQLRDMAKSENREMLAYLIDMAHIEASEEMARGRSNSRAGNHRDSAA